MPRSRLACQIRQALTHGGKALPWIAALATQLIRHAPQRELRRIQLAIHLVPCQRRRHSRPGPRARTERRDRGGAEPVAQPVDQDLAAPIRLLHRRQVAIRLFLAHRLGEGAAERLHLHPNRAAGSSGTTTCSPLPPVVRQNDASPARLQLVAHVVCRLHHVGERDALAGIEVEHDLVGMQRVGFRRAPGVQFDRRHLRHGDQPVDIVDREIRRARGLALADLPAAARRGRASGRSARRAMPSGQRTIASGRLRQPRQRMIGDRQPVFRQVLLGDAGPQLAIGMRQRRRRRPSRHAASVHAPSRSCCRASRAVSAWLRLRRRAARRSTGPRFAPSSAWRRLDHAFARPRDRRVHAPPRAPTLSSRRPR